MVIVFVVAVGCGLKIVVIGTLRMQKTEFIKDMLVFGVRAILFMSNFSVLIGIG